MQIISNKNIYYILQYVKKVSISNIKFNTGIKNYLKLE